MPGNSDSDYTVRGTLQVAQPRPLPDLLDIFIAGGGPGGTAAAFRATELGLSCLVADYDDLLSRIRDYPKEKPLYPDYADDESPFPSGDQFVNALQFQPIDKDELVADWRRKYREFSIPARAGSELTGLTRDSDGVWNVRTWNHRVQQEMVYRACNVIIAIGAGKPRRFQVPGNLDGIAFRLDDAKRYAGAPALVMGGGTSAAEAVISISNAKAAAGDRTAVYWSYRQEQMPRIERNLGSSFFDAYVGNGNIRYLPWSEPILVLTAPDKQEYLSLRVDRKVIEGRPVESVHLEFPKTQVVACIGSDIPHQTLQRFGIKVPTIDGEPYMLVTDDGETSLPGVFLVGDVKGTPEYYRCTDFNDPTTYKKKRDRRTIKMAMRDAVRAVEVVAARDGKIAQPAVAAPTPPPAAALDADATHIVTSPFREAAHQPDAGVQLLALLPDGSIDVPHRITAALTRIGRKTDGITFDDVHMAEHHATLSQQDGKYVLSDSGDGSGVWLRVRGAGQLLEADDQVWMGAQFLRIVEAAGRWAAEHYNSRGELQATHPIDGHGLTLGRAADATLDAGDGSLSRGHARLVAEGNRVRIVDIGSTNGTFVRITAPTVLASGDEFRLATRRLRFESWGGPEPLSPASVVVDVPLAGPIASALETQAGGPLARFEDAKHPVVFTVPPERDLLHAFFDFLLANHPDIDLKRCGHDKSQRCPDDHYKEPLDWSCECGTCGYCAVQIVQGGENVVAADNADLEKSTLQNTRRLSPDLSKYRLACLLRLQGPVTLKVAPKS